MSVTPPRVVKCPSGAELKIHVAPFVDSKNLYQALLRELRDIKVDPSLALGTLYKELFCIGFSSLAIEACLWKCFERCIYNGLKVDKDTFESLEARDDYMVVCMEVAKDNVAPFGKSLYAEYVRMLAMIEKNPT